MRSLRLLACVLLVVAAPGLAFGKPQAEQARRQSGFKFYSGAVSVGVDSSIFTAEGIVEDRVFSVIPTAVAYTSRPRRGSLQFIYEPRFSVYSTYSELNTLNHAAALMYSRRVTGNLTFQAGGSFLRTEDKSLESAGLTVSPRGLFVEGRFYFSATYGFSRDTSVNARIGSSLSQSSVVRSASGSLTGLTTNFAVSLSRRFGSRYRVSVAYAHLVSTFLNPEDLPQEEPGNARQGQDALNVGYAVSLPAGLQLSGSGGAIRQPQDLGKDQFTYSMSARVAKTWRNLTIGCGYRRSLSGLFALESTAPSEEIRDPLLSRNIAEAVNISVAGRFGRRLTIGHSIGVSRTFLQSSDERVEAITATLYGAFVVDDRLRAFVTLSHWDQNATELSRPISRNRITGGLRFHWDSPASTESARSILPVGRVQ